MSAISSKKKEYKEINPFTKSILKETLWPIMRNKHQRIKV